MATSTTIYNDYFNLSTEWKKKEGQQTILLFQVGAFFEVYGIKDLKTGYIQNDVGNESTIEYFSKITNLKIAPKSKTFYNSDANLQIVMAGFRDYQLEDYLQKITDSGYSAVVFVQEDKPDSKTKNRVFSGIYSPGTFIPFDNLDEKISNNIMCIWLKKVNSSGGLSKFICGIVVIDIMTGKSFIFEYENDFKNTPFDELERYISIYKPNEVLWIEQGIIGANIKELFNYSVSFHTIDIQSDKIKNVSKQTYIEEILNKQFGDETYQNCVEFNHFIIATMAFCYLLDFIYLHNRNLVKNISLPVFNNSYDRVILANHTLKQLNILEDGVGNKTGNLSSVLSFLNNCNCSIGKRRFKQQLLNPVYNEEWLQMEYNMISKVLECPPTMIDSMRKKIANIYDIEKISRQLVNSKIYPCSIYKLYHSILMIRDINQHLTVVSGGQPIIQSYLSSKINSIVNSGMNGNIDDSLIKIIDFMNSQVNIEKCNQVRYLNYEEDNEEAEEEDDTIENNMILRPGISTELDDLIAEFKNNKNYFQQWKDTLNQLISKAELKGGSNTTQYVKLHRPKKMGISLQITKTRTKILREVFRNTATIVINGVGTVIETKDIEFSNASTSMNEIEYAPLAKISKKMLVIKESINKVIEKEYGRFLVQLEKDWFPFMDFLIEYVGKLDVLICRAYNAREYGFCPPVLMDASSLSNRSQVKVQNLRHVLIEHLLTNETYTTNDVELTDKPQGILLFGINSSGKTSLLRALGISLILAQSGNFVPATQFEYKPYRSIYSRIIGNDNLFKGHSSFAVEMTELRLILKMANEYSLVLADEISKGSEMDSAMSITTSSIMYFVKLKCSFMITSHLHEIVGFDEIRELSEQVHLKHLSVHYDCEKDCLIYDRKLRDGSGESFYGLLVCKSLHLPVDFIETAYQIRNKYLMNDKGILSQKTSVYNSKKIKGMCEICNLEISEETHHILQQKEANSNGFFTDGIHKNHIGNLSAVCSKCHDKIHSTNELSIVKKKKISFGQYNYKN
jgi:DNA mismatch repair protein MutS